MIPVRTQFPPRLFPSHTGAWEQLIMGKWLNQQHHEQHHVRLCQTCHCKNTAAGKLRLEATLEGHYFNPCVQIIAMIKFVSGQLF